MVNAKQWATFMRDILRALTAALEQDRDLVLCSVVETRGSTPQKAGAAMLVFPDGSQLGTLGGGCVEAEVKQRSLAGFEQRKPEILTFHLDDNYGWDDGLICGGRMRIVAEPLHGRCDLSYFAAFRELVECGHGCTEAVVLEATPAACAAARMVFGPARELAAARHVDEPPPKTRENVRPLAERPRPATRDGVAYLPVLPRCRLVIVGAGHVGQAVAQLAAATDFDVWVIDDRTGYANSERFPAAERIIVGDFHSVLTELPITPHTYCIVVTRGHSHDEEALSRLVRRGAAYLGMIGSKRKVRLIYDDLEATGVPRELLDRVRAPLGIDIGSQTVPEIAVSIVAELIAHRNRREESPGTAPNR